MTVSKYLHPVLEIEKFKVHIADAKKALRRIKFDAFVVTGNSGTLFGGALAVAMNKGLILVRKPNDNSHGVQVEGRDEHKLVVFLDDFISSGKTRDRALEALRLARHFKNCVYVGSWLYKHDLWEPEEYDSCPKCGTRVLRRDACRDAFVDEGEGEESGRTFYYCSSHCRKAH
jgi:adenine/guanine phosphoribosyltransferase-like PRPP-binding protein